MAVLKYCLPDIILGTTTPRDIVFGYFGDNQPDMPGTEILFYEKELALKDLWVCQYLAQIKRPMARSEMPQPPQSTNHLISIGILKVTDDEKVDFNGELIKCYFYNKRFGDDTRFGTGFI